MDEPEETILDHHYTETQPSLAQDFMEKNANLDDQVLVGCAGDCAEEQSQPNVKSFAVHPKQNQPEKE